MRGDHPREDASGRGGASTPAAGCTAKLVTEVARRAALASEWWTLTRRQADVLAILARGHSNLEIAAALGCAVSTVEFHVTALLTKSRSRSRAELVARFWTELE